MAQTGAAASGLVKCSMPNMISRTYAETFFALRWMEKDARYAIAEGEALGVPLRTVRAAWEAFALGLNDPALADADFSAVIASVAKGPSA
jgi:3-hydroxyisobutyrate dehydrogenase-like beta-hydroxyacid dehydrogenase